MDLPPRGSQAQATRNGEIGYTLHPDVWGRGYATLVADALARHAFTRLGCERVAATCRPGNIGSIRVLEKAGFCQEGRLRRVVVIHDDRQDSLIFGRLATDGPTERTGGRV